VVSTLVQHVAGVAPPRHAQQDGFGADVHEVLAQVIQHHALLQGDERAVIEAAAPRTISKRQDAHTHTRFPDPSSRPQQPPIPRRFWVFVRKSRTFT
jgi:hypothetical protein